MKNLKNIIRSHPYYISVMSGLISGIVYAPYFILFMWMTLSLFLYTITTINTGIRAFNLGYIFGFGHFLTSLYWMANALVTFKDDFWWFIPFALLGLPMILGVFIGAASFGSYFFRNTKYFTIIFAIFWILAEYLRSFIFTGFPWNLAGYSVFFSDILCQQIFLISIYGVSFVVIYFFTSFTYILTGSMKSFWINIILSSLLILTGIIYGFYRLNNHPSKFLETKIRIVQPSIQQYSKWDEGKFWENLNTHIMLSIHDNGFKPDLIIWSESALPTFINSQEIRSYIAEAILSRGQYILTGAISYNGTENLVDNDYKIFVSFAAININNQIEFLYDKIHLVPFGEYIPFKRFLPIKKITSGLLDYSVGVKSRLVKLKNLNIRPLICYEAIFPDEVGVDNNNTDLFINVTNDGWYGNSMGPYQHLHMSRARSIETGIPMIRATANGISAIIDPLGRIISYIGVNEVKILDGYIPEKYQGQSIPNNIKYLIMTLIIICILFTLSIKSFVNR